MMRIFLDTKFTSLGLDPQLISVGLVAEDGRARFYAELPHAGLHREMSDYARGSVLPQLEGGAAQMSFHELGERLLRWIEDFEEPVQAAIASLSWDWSWLREIFYEHWPHNLSEQPLLLRDGGDDFKAAVEAAFQGGLRRHHALDHALANRIGWIVAGGGPADSLMPAAGLHGSLESTRTLEYGLVR